MGFFVIYDIYNKTNFMGRSYSKIRHIQESNEILEKRLMIEQSTTKSVEMPKETDKTSSVVNYKELKSETTFAPQYKTGTPIVQIGTYYMTVPEFEEYKKTKPNTNFIKI
jgi:hypothetical protein